MDEVERRLAKLEEHFSVMSGQVWALKSAVLVLLPCIPGIEKTVDAARNRMEAETKAGSLEGLPEQKRRHLDLINETALETMDLFLEVIQDIREACAARLEQERLAAAANQERQEPDPT